MEETPSQQEQKEVYSYCRERPLVRPDTNLVTATLSALVFLVIVITLSSGTLGLVTWLGVHYQIGGIALHSFAQRALVVLLVFLLCLILVLKRLAIGMVKLYQHYAPENLRRKCLLKPTCSEYMILAIEKYGVIRGVWKGGHRLLFTCQGFVYHIDEP